MTSFMRALTLGLAVVCMTGCETTAPKKTAKTTAATTHINGLPAQELVSGVCGIFFWSITSPKHFVFFQEEGSDTAQLFYEGRAQKLRALQVTSGLEDSYGFSLNYIGKSNEKITAKGVYSDSLEGGRRISDAAILIGKDDGWQEIMPVSGLYVCR